MLKADRGGASGKAILVLSYLVPAGFVGSVLLLLISLQSGAQATAASVATLLPVGYAFGAGMVASVNPCGFFLLPSYLSYHLGTEEAGFYRTSSSRRLLQALSLGSTATLGFIVIFAAVGTIIIAGGRWLATYFPYGGVAIGVAMLGLGVWLLVTHRTIGIMAASRVTLTPRRNLWNVLLFGMAYAVGSLSCTLPVFLVVVGTALVSQGGLYAFSQFVSYALGMGTILIAVTIGAALFRGAVARRLRAAIPYVHRMSALFLVGAGLYLLYYWLIYADVFF